MAGLEQVVIDSSLRVIGDLTVTGQVRPAVAWLTTLYLNGTVTAHGATLNAAYFNTGSNSGHASGFVLGNNGFTPLGKAATAQEYKALLREHLARTSNPDGISGWLWLPLTGGTNGVPAAFQGLVYVFGGPFTVTGADGFTCGELSRPF